MALPIDRMTVLEAILTWQVIPMERWDELQS